MSRLPAQPQSQLHQDSIEMRFQYSEAENTQADRNDAYFSLEASWTKKRLDILN